STTSHPSCCASPRIRSSGRGSSSGSTTSPASHRSWTTRYPARSAEWRRASAGSAQRTEDTLHGSGVGRAFPSGIAGDPLFLRRGPNISQTSRWHARRTRAAPMSRHGLLLAALPLLLVTGCAVTDSGGEPIAEVSEAVTENANDKIAFDFFLAKGLTPV